jgi:hypothetical protein
MMWLVAKLAFVTALLSSLMVWAVKELAAVRRVRKVKR